MIFLTQESISSHLDKREENNGVEEELDDISDWCVSSFSEVGNIEKTKAVWETLDGIVIEKVTFKVLRVVDQKVGYEAWTGPEDAAPDQVVSGLGVVHEVVLVYEIFLCVVYHARAEFLFQLLLL